MATQSAGILLYRLLNGLEVFLVHPGGPFFTRKDEGFWTIPKGEFLPPETALDAAVREFREETGVRLAGPFVPLVSVRQKGGKVVHAWAAEGDIDASAIISNTFDLEWPPRSGRKQSFPEVDRAGWFDVATAQIKINAAQTALIGELAGRVGA